MKPTVSQSGVTILDLNTEIYVLYWNNSISEIPIIALTATATPKVQEDIMKNLRITDAKVFKASFNRPNLYYEVRPKTAQVDSDIIRFIKQNPNKSGHYLLSPENE